MKKLSLIAAAMLLAACSSGGDDGFPGTPPTPTPPTPPVVTPPVAGVDALFTRVNGIAGNQPDDGEPIEIGAEVITMPEDSEPVTL